MMGWISGRVAAPSALGTATASMTGLYKGLYGDHPYADLRQSREDFAAGDTYTAAQVRDAYRA